MILEPNPISTRQITYDPDHIMLVGEISSTNGFGRVFDDACDEGLTVVSHRTGKSIVYAVSHIERGDDGIAFWDLIPADRRQKHLPKLRLFND